MYAETFGIVFNEAGHISFDNSAQSNHTSRTKGEKLGVGNRVNLFRN